jgi:hypothetical protein
LPFLGFLGWIDRLFYSCYTKYEKSKFLSLVTLNMRKANSYP